MAKRRSAKWLAKAVLDGCWESNAALEEHLHENYQGPLDIPPYSRIHLAICCVNMGWQDRVLELDNGPLTAGEVVREFGLEPFLPLFDRQEEVEFRRGDLVAYYDEVYRVVGRREVWPDAEFRLDDFELFIESEDGGTFAFVGESELEPLEADEAVKI